MANPHWTMSVITDSKKHEMDFYIIDNHHRNNFYGAWHAKDKHDLYYHLEGLEECINRGTYRRNQFVFNGNEVESWPDFQQKLKNYFNFYDPYALFDIA